MQYLSMMGYLLVIFLVETFVLVVSPKAGAWMLSFVSLYGEPSLGNSPLYPSDVGLGSFELSSGRVRVGSVAWEL